MRSRLTWLVAPLLVALQLSFSSSSQVVVADVARAEEAHGERAESVPVHADNASPQAFHADANAPPVITDDTVDRAVTDFFSTSTTTTTTTTDSDQPLAVAHNMAVSGHTNNWAVLVCTSRFWFNYRHIANTLSVYRTVKRLGVPDSNIILMLADDMPCNARNKFAATVFNNADRRIDLYGGAGSSSSSGSSSGSSSNLVEVDYRGYEVTVENFIRLLTGRHDDALPKSKRLQTDDRSNILIYMTGHGGDEFLKFQDAEEISSYDLADAFHQMHEKKRYNEILFIADTCQAATLHTRFYSPNIVAAGSSLKGENSYSHHSSSNLGVAVIDRFTYYMLDYFEREMKSMQSLTTLDQMFSSFNPSQLMSTHAVRSDLMRRPLTDIPLVDFFGNVQQVELTGARYTLADRRKASSSKKETTILGEIPEPLAFQKKSSHSDDETRSSSTSDHYRKMAITIDHHLRQLFDYNTFMEDPAARLRDLLSDGKHLAGALYGTLVTADYTAGSTLPHLMPIVRKQAQTSATRRKKAESVTSGWSTIVSAVLAFVGLLTMLF